MARKKKKERKDRPIKEIKKFPSGKPIPKKLQKRFKREVRKLRKGS